MEIRIDKWVYGGEGLARVDGRVVLAPFVLPGETASVELEEGLHARLTQVMEAAPERVQPPCPLFQRCGGCHYQHAPYDFQVSQKVEILREQLRRVGKIEYPGQIDVVAGPPLGYRNRIQVHVADGKLGYRAAKSHDLVALTGDCPVASPRLNQALAEMRERLNDPRFPNFVSALELFTNETELQVNVVESSRPVAGRFYEWCESVPELEYPTAHGAFRVSPRSFFQVNRFLADTLVETALGAGAGGSALDLYAGVGLFALPMALRYGSVTAVEAGPSAVRDLKFNAARVNASIAVQQTRVEDYLSWLESTPEFVLADPPRAGLGKTVVRELKRLAPPRITIVSCDPATLARDLAGLEEYSIERLAMVDLFPQTYHLETVVALVRQD